MYYVDPPLYVPEFAAPLLYIFFVYNLIGHLDKEQKETIKSNSYIRNSLWGVFFLLQKKGAKKLLHVIAFKVLLISLQSLGTKNGAGHCNALFQQKTKMALCCCCHWPENWAIFKSFHFLCFLPLSTPPKNKPKKSGPHSY